MARGVLLDSSVVIAHLRHRLDLRSLIEAGETLYLPLTALGELYKGVLKSVQVDKNRSLLEAFLGVVAVLSPDTATALYYAQISAMLERQGTPIPENDIWIAAMAVEYSMPLATRDEHFSHIHGLQLLNW